MKKHYHYSVPNQRRRGYEYEYFRRIREAANGGLLMMGPFGGHEQRLALIRADIYSRY